MRHFEPSAIACYLAQREALAGAAQTQFLQILAGDFLYRRPAPGRGGWLLGSLAAGFLGLGADVWLHRGALPDWLWFGWPALSAAGLALAVAIRPPQEDTAPRDRELHWRVYCVMVRPIILAERPGLLDRNLPVYHAPLGQLARTPLTTVGALTLEHGPEFWRAALIGLWVGMAALLGFRFVLGVGSLQAVWLPVAGAGLGPVVWGVGQWFAFKTVVRDPRLEGVESSPPAE